MGFLQNAQQERKIVRPSGKPEAMLITENLKPAQISTNPFPHLVATNLLPADFYCELQEALPDLPTLLKGQKPGSNRRFNYSATNIAFNPQISQQFKTFVQDHLNQAFLDDFLRLFGSHILDQYPDFESRYKPINRLKAGIRGADGSSDADVLLDFQIAFNTPSAVAGTTVRSAHIDCPRKLFVGLFYMRQPGDQSSGADLNICRAKSKNLKLDATRTADEKEIETVTQVKYQSNTLVLFLNTPQALHAVTARGRSPVHRVFLNILGEMREPLFELSGAPAGETISAAGLHRKVENSAAHIQTQPSSLILPFFSSPQKK